MPSLIFGRLLSSIWDDNEKKAMGFRNGVFTNLFSIKFVVEYVDEDNGLKFHQVFRNNMTIVEDAVIHKCTEAELEGGRLCQN